MGCKKDEASNTSLEGTWELENYKNHILYQYERDETMIAIDSLTFLIVKVDSIRIDTCYSSWSFYEFSLDTGRMERYFFYDYTLYYHCLDHENFPCPNDGGDSIRIKNDYIAMYPFVIECAVLKLIEYIGLHTIYTNNYNILKHSNDELMLCFDGLYKDGVMYGEYEQPIYNFIKKPSQ